MEHLERPGCFGFVVCYEPDSEFCAGCNHESSCAAVVLERRTALAKLLAGRVAGAAKGPPKRAAMREKVAPATPAPTPHFIVTETVVEVNEGLPKRGGSAPKRYAAGEMSKKARQLDESLKRLNIEAVDSLKAGKNPMDGIDRLSFFKIACDVLLAEGALDRAKLHKAYMDSLGWDTKTAASHLSIIASYMVATGILAVDGKCLIRVAR